MTKVFSKLPKHIAFIIDGNGRWAKRRGLPRMFGHRAGIKTLEENIIECRNLGVDVVSVFGFSTENWNRPQAELDGLFGLFEKFFTNNTIDFMGLGIKVRVMGDYTKFPPHLVDNANALIEQTRDNNKMILNMGINYGGHDDILHAVNNMIKDGVEVVDKKTMENYLYTAGLPAPDFVIRTSGELRISNFMLWQMAYSELYFPKTYWPDFHKKHLYKALKSYQKRNRRYGAIKEEKK